MKVIDGLTKATAVPVWDGTALRLAVQKMGGEPPVWVQVFPYPKYVCTIDGRKKTLITDDASQQSIVEFWSEKGNDLFIDYEHATTEEGVFYAPAAGRMVEVVAGGKLGLLARCEWTDEAAEDIRAGRYYYDSPTFWWAEDDSRIYILAGLALTNFPGSYHRPYITDHNETNYEALLERAAARATTSRETRPLTLKCAKGGAPGMKKKLNAAFQKLMQSVQKITDDALRSIRYAFDLPMTTTGNELKAFLAALNENIAASDEPIFIVEEEEKEAAEGAKTLGEFLTRLAQQKAGDEEEETAVDLKPLRVALGVKDADAGVDALVEAALSMKATMVPIARVHELERKLAETTQKSVKERTDLLIAQNRAKVRPEQEKEIHELAEQDFKMAEKFVSMLPSIDLTAQSDKPAPKSPSDPATPASVVDESKTAHERTLAIANEKGISYSAANEQRKKEEAAAVAKQ